MKTITVIKKEELGIIVESSLLKTGENFTLVTIQKAKLLSDGMDSVTVSIEDLRTILAKAEETK